MNKYNFLTFLPLIIAIIIGLILRPIVVIEIILYLLIVGVAFLFTWLLLFWTIYFYDKSKKYEEEMAK